MTVLFAAEALYTVWFMLVRQIIRDGIGPRHRLSVPTATAATTKCGSILWNADLHNTVASWPIDVAYESFGLIHSTPMSAR